MEKENMKIVIVGHVDHGKSTLIGRLLYETKSIPTSILEEVKKVCEELGREVEFAFLLDSLEEEREQNVTIDTTQIFFKTLKRDYVIIDAPGHVEFIKNMITGASQAEAAILIVDVKEGVKEQTKRHAYILGMLGLKQVIVIINKMDKVSYDEKRFNYVKKELLGFLMKLNIQPRYTIPVSCMKGDNIASNSDNLPWYKGVTILSALDAFSTPRSLSEKPMRFPVQDVYKVADKIILVGKVESGIIKKGDDVLFLPSNKKSKIHSIEVWNKDKAEAEAGESIGVTIEDPLFIERGEIICSGNVPKVIDALHANIFWMGKKPIKRNEKLILKCATQEVDCVLEDIKRKMNSSTLEVIGKDCDELNETEVADVIIKTSKPIVLESFNDIGGLGRFVLEREGNTVAGGIIIE